MRCLKINNKDCAKNKYIGNINTNNFGSLMSIYEYRSWYDIDILFLENNYIAYNRKCNDFFSGTTKSPYEKRSFNVGFIGEGKYKIQNDNKERTRTYHVWKGILERCYSVVKQKKSPTYIGCTMCDEWLDFQNFAKWYEEYYYEIEEEVVCLDKDILFKGNKVYSPDTCIFVPMSINSLFTKTNSKRGDFPIGVSYHKRDNVYQSNCNNGEKKETYLGYYNTPIQAFNTYKKYKEVIIKNIADKYKGKIPQKLYEAMYKYEVEITD